MIVGQGPIALAVGAGGGCLNIFFLIYLFSFLSPSLWETARYRLKYCLKGPLNPKQQTNQPTIPGRLPKTGRKKREKIVESKNVQTTTTRTYYKRRRPLSYYHPKCRTPRHWKFTQDYRTTAPPTRQYLMVIQTILIRIASFRCFNFVAFFFTPPKY